MKRLALCASFALGLGAFGPPANAESDIAPIGFWLNPEQGWVVETMPCGTGVCGILVDFPAANRPGYVARDRHNQDPAKRNTPLCGLNLLGGFTPSKDGTKKWENGWVYDPENGATYRGEAELVDRDVVKLRGYVLTPLFGRTLTLVRETGAIRRCAVPPEEATASADAGKTQNLAQADFADARRR